MPRQSRKKSSTGIYHVMLRGINKQDIFEEGYCQAERYVYDASQDEFTFCYYDRDHLGNIRQVTEADGTSTGNVIQTMNYYPFGAEFCDGTANSSVQSHKYNGKELDVMHGLNTYDYGARQYYSILGRWDRIDPLCEKYYSLSPYNYCGNNPIKFIDPDGMWPWPWERGSLIEYRGNGVFGLRIGNFSKTTQSNFYAANSNPHKWAYREIGLNTELGCISIHHYGHEAYSPSRKLPGIDPQNSNIRIRRPTAVSTGQEDRRFHQFPPTFAKGRGGAGVILALDAAIGVTDTFLTLSTFWDIEAFEDQYKSLTQAIRAVSSFMDPIPDKYRNDANKIGAIINYVFQGENITNDKYIKIIGDIILRHNKRYDDKEKRCKPFIEE